MQTLLAARSACTLVLIGCAAACNEHPPQAKRPPTVRVELAQVSNYAPTITLTGEVAARVTSDLSFQVSGQVVDRRVEVGDRVTEGQILATLDPREQQQNLAAAQANVDAADAKLREATSSFERQKALIRQGFTTRPTYDQAEADLRAAQGALDSAKAQLGISRDQLDQTVLRSRAAGVITARQVEAGQVVQVAQTVYTLAQDGPRDAVFYAYESIFIREPVDKTIRVALVSDPERTSLARPREISPVVDTTNGTVRVKFEIVDPRPDMSLGAPIVGVGQIKPREAVTLPWSALASDGGAPAVWVVDSGTKAVTLKPVSIEVHELGHVVIAKGLAPGEAVVTRGQQFLHPGQIVAPVTGAGS